MSDGDWLPEKRFAFLSGDGDNGQFELALGPMTA